MWACATKIDGDIRLQSETLEALGVKRSTRRAGRCSIPDGSSVVLFCGKFNSGVKAVWVRIFALFAFAVLLANAQCYAICTGDGCGLTRAPSNCHHHHPKSSDGDPGPCPFQHSQFSAPEAGIAKISLETTAIFVVPLLVGFSSAAVAGLHFLPRLATGSPPARGGGSTISVLRL
jgi:hypothetical protein